MSAQAVSDSILAVEVKWLNNKLAKVRAHTGCQIQGWHEKQGDWQNLTDTASGSYDYRRWVNGAMSQVV